MSSQEGQACDVAVRYALYFAYICNVNALYFAYMYYKMYTIIIKMANIFLCVNSSGSIME